MATCSKVYFHFRYSSPDDFRLQCSHVNMPEVRISVCKSVSCPKAISRRSHQSIFINTLRPRQNGHRFANNTFKRNLLNGNVRISIKILLKFVPKGPINNNSALFQIMAWCRSGDKPLSEPMMVSLLTHICVTRPQ